MPRGKPAKHYTITEYREEGRPTKWAVIARRGQTLALVLDFDLAVAVATEALNNPEEANV